MGFWVVGKATLGLRMGEARRGRRVAGGLGTPLATELEGLAEGRTWVRLQKDSKPVNTYGAAFSERRQQPGRPLRLMQ